MVIAALLRAPAQAEAHRQPFAKRKGLKDGLLLSQDSAILASPSSARRRNRIGQTCGPFGDIARAEAYDHIIDLHNIGEPRCQRIGIGDGFGEPVTARL
jgi:hypothetical protein